MKENGNKVSWAVVQHFRSLDLTLVAGNPIETITKIQNNMPAKMYRLISTTFPTENETFFSTDFGTTVSN